MAHPVRDGAEPALCPVAGASLMSLEPLLFSETGTAGVSLMGAREPRGQLWAAGALASDIPIAPLAGHQGQTHHPR